MRTNSRWLIPLLALILVAPAAAQLQHPNIERGFSVAKSFDFDDIDNVNIFNGNLTLTIPIGSSYPIGGELAYNLTLVYNSKLWDWEAICVAGEPSCRPQARPNQDSNAGFGWMLSLGELFAPGSFPRNPGSRWLYVSPDGGEHQFFDSLHLGDPTVSNVFYTRDGTYLRMKLAGGFREVEFPNGDRHRFQMIGNVGRIVSFRDRFANQLTVGYPNATTWTLNDGHRSHTVRFINRLLDGRSVPMVDRVQLAAFGGTTATYTFGYSQVNVQRPCPFSELPPEHPFHIGFNATVNLLTAVVLPDGSRYSMPTSDYILTQAGFCRASGVIKKIKLPTLGGLSWDWGTYTFPSGEEPPPPVRASASAPLKGLPVPEEQFPEWLLDTLGVAKRRVLRATGSTAGEWQYTQQLIIPPAPPGGGLRPQPVESRTTVRSPLSDRVIHYFSVYNGGGAPEHPKANTVHYGLPFTVKTTDSTSPARYLSRQVRNSGNQLKRTMYVRYEWDKPWRTSGIMGDETRANRRVASERMTYNDDGGRWSATDQSSFDGLGNYRTTRLRGNFSSGNNRTETARYNPASGTYNIDPVTENPGPGHNFTMLAASAPWVLDTFTETTQVEGGVTAKQSHCFEAATGFAKRRRIHKSGTGRNSHDVVVEFTRDGRGNVLTESYYGGDNRSVSTSSNLCGIGLSGHDYRLRHAYSAGVRRFTAYQTAGNADLSHREIDDTIDARSGLVSASRDVSGLQTGFEYDKMGRVTWVKPAAGHGSWDQLIYTRATSANALAWVRMLRRGNGSKTAPVLAEQRTRFDEMGRVWREQVVMPNGTLATRETRYNALDWKTHVSEQQAGTPNRFTRFLSYDPFGRPTKIRPPDGSAHDVTLSYTGERVVRRTAKVRTGGNSATITESSATTTEQYDRQGRLWRVTEPAGGITATHGYDVGGRLASVDLRSGGITQRRRFNYDNRGFLTSERHPELTASQSGGFIRYSMLDARGHPGRVNDNVVTLRQLFDRAERLWQTKDATNGQIWKQWTFATANSGSNRRKGRLWKASRHNRVNTPWPPQSPVTVTVTEEYFYQGRDGRVSRRNTTLNTGQAFNQSWIYDPLGNVTRLGYPRCTAGNCAAAVQPTRNQTFGYTRGFLTSVPGFASSIQYHPSGMVSRVAHTNGTNLFFDADPNGIRRPSNVRLTTPTGSAELGLHRYDGAGNLVARGLEYYLYDTKSRLTRYNTTTTTNQTYVYDGFGNLRQMSTFNGSTQTRTLAMNSAKNRLSGGIYDARGGLLQFGGEVFRYDSLGTLTHKNFPLKTFVYTADDRRIWDVTFRTGQPLEEAFTVRDLDGKPLRVVTGTGGVWSWKKDYIHRDGVMLAAATSEPSPRNIQHFAVDHLGSPRSISDRFGNGVEGHHFFGFGEELAEGGNEARRFTGQERDLNNPGTVDNLDYMLARYYSPHLGRFLTLDKGGDFDPSVPQSWNRYTYARNNPVKFVDPDGNVIETAWDVFNVGLGLASLRQNIKEGNVLGAVLDAGGVILDTAAAITPVVPGGASTALKAARAAKKAEQIRKNSRAGKAFEEFVLAKLGRLGDRKKAIDSLTGTAARRFPDGQTRNALIEVKNVKQLKLTDQLKDFLASAKQENKKFVIFVRKRADLVIDPDLLKLQEQGELFIKIVDGFP